jgi:hypothetical protein
MMRDFTPACAMPFLRLKQFYWPPDEMNWGDYNQARPPISA